MCEAIFLSLSVNKWMCVVSMCEIMGEKFVVHGVNESLSLSYDTIKLRKKQQYTQQS